MFYFRLFLLIMTLILSIRYFVSGNYIIALAFTAATVCWAMVCFDDCKEVKSGNSS
jgi:hypothetical protein